MMKFIFSFIIFNGLLFFEYPKDITGTWYVEKVDAAELEAKANSQQKAMMKKMMVDPMTHSQFEFKPSHHFHLTAHIPSMPTADFWEYNPEEGKIEIRQFKDRSALIMRMHIIEKGDGVYFVMDETSVSLKMKRIE